MEIVKQFGWVYYVKDDALFDRDKVGKWMYFFDNKKFVAKICKESVEMNIVKESKHSDKETGVACFYLNCDDMKTHKKILSYFMENNLIQRTKNGRLYNISFKLDNQTRAGEYGDDFKSDIKLANFVNLDTGEWLI